MFSHPSQVPSQKWHQYLPGRRLLTTLVILIGMNAAVSAGDNQNHSSTFNPSRAVRYAMPDDHIGVKADTDNNQPPEMIPLRRMPTASPGTQVGSTTYDMQHNCAMGRQIATDPALNHVHMVWMAKSDFIINTTRWVYYQGYDPATATYLESYNPAIWDYSGFPTCDAVNDGRAVIGAHITPDIEFLSAGFIEYEPEGGFFIGYTAFPNPAFGLQETYWPIIEVQYGATSDVIYMLAHAGNSDTNT